MINKSLASLLLATLLSSAVIGQSSITTRTTWDQDTIITETVIVEIGASLTIEAGTTVLFEAGTGLEVNGNIWVNGTKDNPVIFSGKDSVFWEGVYLKSSSYSAIDTAKFTHAHIYYGGRENGGAIEVNGKEGIELTHCKIMYNKGSLGGALYVNGSDRIYIRNTLIANNESENGAVHFINGNLTLSNVTIANNRSSGVGGLYSESALINIFNSILALNDSSNLYFDRGERSYPILPRFSLIEEGYLGSTNISGDPLFKDITNHEYSLSENSPAIDAGCHCFIDDDGTRSDMGYLAFDQHSSEPLPYILVDSTTNLNDSWTDTAKPYAICGNISVDEGESLSLGKGIEVLFIFNREITVKGDLITDATADEPIHITSYDTTYFEFDDDDLRPIRLGWSGINFANGKGNTLDNVIFSNMGQEFFYYHELHEQTSNEQIGVYDNSSLILQNCSFIDNTTPYKSGFDSPNGMLYVETGSDLEVRTCTISGCKSYTPGSIMIYASRANLEIRKSTFINNKAFNVIEFRGSSSGQPKAHMLIDSCFFSNNYFNTTYPSAIIEVNAPSGESLTTISNNIFENNVGGFELSGATDIVNNIYRYNSFSTMNIQFHDINIMGNLIYHNEDFQLYVESFQSLYMVNNTITANTTDERFTVGLFSSSSPQNVHNNILYNNLPANLWEGSLSSLNSGNRSFKSNITNESIDALNFIYDPLFVDADTHDYGLAANSPAINNAVEDGVIATLSTYDILGNERIDSRYSKLDIGAIEFQGEISSLNDILLSDTIIFTDALVGDPIASIFTEEPLNASFYLLDESGFETQAFSIEETNLILNKTISEGNIFRIKIRAEQTDNNAWLEKSFFIHTSLPLGLGNSEIPIHPNPTQNTIHLPDQWLNQVINISDLNGKMVYVIPRLKETTLEVSSLKAGTYLIQNGSESYKFIKLKP
ncbi:right-handed parallel beta-helix repeat-containing protein [Ekhidna sp. To15]|uniref:right-handed parallel beta-helix repeat-containing protein n=1 Tax=Ekhidna sp. To15 TaxID=3395267 RepID=UPI003F520A82